MFDFQDIPQEQSAEALKELKAMCEELKKLDRKMKRAERIFDVRKARYDSLKLRIRNILEAAELPSFDSPDARINLVRIATAKLPEDEARKKFFNYLKERGEFDALISVNSQTLNAYVKRESELHADDPCFAIPGIEIGERLDVRVKIK